MSVTCPIFSNTLVSMMQTDIYRHPLVAPTLNVYFFSMMIPTSMVADAKKRVTYKEILFKIIFFKKMFASLLSWQKH